MILTLIKTLIALQGGLSPTEKYPKDYAPNLKNGDTFDFIVVGAGSAGSVVASRLSENPDWKILLIEAGGYPSGLSEIPAMAFSLQDTEEDWQFQAEPSETCCLSLTNKRCRCPRGKGLGGSSLINYMMYTRSTRHDQARWSNAGNDGWDYDSIDKYYKKIENVNIEDNRHYGTSGELHLTKYTSNQPIRQALSNAYQELGLDEYTEDKPIGFRDVLVSIFQGTRQNAAKALLLPAADRKSLHLALNAQVSKLLLYRDKLAVHGVEVKIGSQILNLQAKKEVILSAGSINSPQILMNSGIGPAKHLSEVGVKVVHDLNVGENLQDHVLLPLIFTVDHSALNPTTTVGLMSEVYQYFMNKQGILGNIDLTNFCTYMNTKNESSFANAQVVHGVVPPQDPYLIHEVLRAIGMPEDLAKTITDHNKNRPLLVFLPVLLHPKSRGFVRLRNSDLFSRPVIKSNYLSDENGEDTKVLLNAIKFLKQLPKTKALSAYDLKSVDLNITNCSEFKPESDDYWMCAIRNIANTAYHPLGTCKMGPESDSSAVVDPQLKVHGVKGVRVIDGSVIPLTTSSNTNAPILMVGERGADLIKSDWSSKHDEL